MMNGYLLFCELKDFRPAIVMRWQGVFVWKYQEGRLIRSLISSMKNV